MLSYMYNLFHLGFIGVSGFIVTFNKIALFFCKSFYLEADIYELVIVS